MLQEDYESVFRSHSECIQNRLSEVGFEPTRLDNQIATWMQRFRPLFNLTPLVRLQGPIIQVWPSGQITLTGDVIGSRGGALRYDATMMIRDPAMKLL